MSEDLKPLEKPVDWDELYDGAFLKAGDLKGKKWTLTIKSVDIYELEGAKGKQKRGVIEFEKTPKLIAINKINGLCLKAMFGRQVQGWVGRRVTIFPDVVKEAGKMQGEPCIRIWGSPELAHDLDVTIHLQKRKPYVLTMHKVAVGAKSDAAREPGADG